MDRLVLRLEGVLRNGPDDAAINEVLAASGALTTEEKRDIRRYPFYNDRIRSAAASSRRFDVLARLFSEDLVSISNILDDVYFFDRADLLDKLVSSGMVVFVQPGTNSHAVAGERPKVQLAYANLITTACKTGALSVLNWAFDRYIALRPNDPLVADAADLPLHAVQAICAAAHSGNAAVFDRASLFLCARNNASGDRLLASRHTPLVHAAASGNIALFNRLWRRAEQNDSFTPLLLTTMMTTAPEYLADGPAYAACMQGRAAIARSVLERASNAALKEVEQSFFLGINVKNFAMLQHLLNCMLPVEHDSPDHVAMAGRILAFQAFMNPDLSLADVTETTTVAQYALANKLLMAVTGGVTLADACQSKAARQRARAAVASLTAHGPRVLNDLGSELLFILALPTGSDTDTVAAPAPTWHARLTRCSDPAAWELAHKLRLARALAGALATAEPNYWTLKNGMTLECSYVIRRTPFCPPRFSLLFAVAPPLELVLPRELQTLVDAGVRADDGTCALCRGTDASLCDPAAGGCVALRCTDDHEIFAFMRRNLGAVTGAYDNDRNAVLTALFGSGSSRAQHISEVVATHLRNPCALAALVAAVGPVFDPASAERTLTEPATDSMLVEMLPLAGVLHTGTGVYFSRIVVALRVLHATSAGFSFESLERIAKKAIRVSAAPLLRWAADLHPGGVAGLLQPLIRGRSWRYSLAVAAPDFDNRYAADAPQSLRATFALVSDALNNAHRDAAPAIVFSARDRAAVLSPRVRAGSELTPLETALSVQHLAFDCAVAFVELLLRDGAGFRVRADEIAAHREKDDRTRGALSVEATRRLLPEGASTVLHSIVGTASYHFACKDDVASALRSALEAVRDSEDVRADLEAASQPRLL
jgi:hypothetical protein